MPIGDLRAEGSAFVPEGWTGMVMLFRFGTVAYHTTEPKILADQLRMAKPATATAGDRLGG